MLETWTPKAMATAAGSSPAITPPSLSLSVGSSQSWHVRCAKVGTDRNCVLACFYPYCPVTSTRTKNGILAAYTCFPGVQHVPQP